MKILVTGGCGFIGSHVVDAFVDKGYEVVIVDNLSSGTLANKNERARFYRVDICTPELEEIIHDEEPEMIFHHAAQISVPLSVRDPLLDAEVNIKGTLRLLELSRTHGVKRFVFASTGGAIYGDANDVPTPEDYVPQPSSPYAISKLSCEHYIRFYGKQHNLGHVILRYSNVYGPRQIPHGEAGVVAIFIEALLSKKLPTLNHFPGKPEGMIRDYCFVKDIASANLLAATTNEPGTYNIGTGKGTTTRQLYREILQTLRLVPIDLPPLYDHPRTDEAREGDIKVSTLNTDRARERLGFRPAFQLTEGIAQTVEWYLAKQKVKDQRQP
jgi:UDP-glucose 4-epimerase